MPRRFTSVGSAGTVVLSAGSSLMPWSGTSTIRATYFPALMLLSLTAGGPGGPPAVRCALGRERGVERSARRGEGQRADEVHSLGGADQAVHAGVFPLHRDRAVVPDRVEHPEACFPRDVAVTGRDEVPAAARVTPRQVRAHPAVAAVADLLLRVLAVDVVDPVLEVPEEADRVEVLPDEVRRVPVEAERLAVPDRLHGRNRRRGVYAHVRRVHGVREAHAALVEDVEDRVPPVG